MKLYIYIYIYIYIYAEYLFKYAYDQRSKACTVEPQERLINMTILSNVHLTD